MTYDADLIKKHCLVADDVWLKVIETIAGVPVVAATADQLLEYVPDTQEIALCHVNTEAGGNDVILASLLGELESKGVLPKPFADLVRDDSLDACLTRL